MARLPTFPHGIHPPTHKADTEAARIHQFPFAPVLEIPFQQHTGAPARPVVREGQEVQRGQLIAEPDGELSVAMHASASGVIRRIGLMPSATGAMVEGAWLVPHPSSTQEIAEGRPCELERASPEEILEAIRMAGIVGLGGAAFPTHVKLRIPDDTRVDTLVVNGAECEPYLTADHRVMLEHADDVMTGIGYVRKATGVERALIGVEDNKRDAAAALEAAAPADGSVRVQRVAVKYPQGAEKTLIRTLLGRVVPTGSLPSAVGCVVVNVSTLAEIGRLLPRGQGIQERVLTIAGSAVERRGNYRVPIGTPLRYALEQAGLREDVSRVFLGGPMMGTALASLDVPITKGTTGFVALTDPELRSEKRVFPCIGCGYCVDACPQFLNPARLGLLARNGEYKEMAEAHRLADCFECGACTWVCPSHLPLVQSFRSAKAALKRVPA
ncbi:MAG: electron transport complex subunit RsxC [Pseudomonadales bacterium]|jgi:electron transport complex protein RnfC|nr:electron transport complex subunit RsxC [Pseudomonadales bacterium]